VPPDSPFTVKAPSLPETTLNSAPVPLFLILTSAPGMTAPELSTTVPDNEVKKLPCAKANGVPRNRAKSRAALTLIENLIHLSLLVETGLTNDWAET
jgi:hypothetical protein